MLLVLVFLSLDIIYIGMPGVSFDILETSRAYKYVTALPLSDLG